MKPGRWWIGLVIAFAVVSLWAGEFWEEKPYSEWAGKEAQKLMTDSPWARRVEIRVYEPMWSPRSTGGRATTASEPTEGGAMPGVTRQDTRLGGRFKTYTVQWWSARVVRQAAVRLRQLQGSVTTEQAEQFLGQRPGHYIIMVFGQNMQGFEGLSAEELKAKTYLKGKKQKVAPEWVNFLPGPDEQLHGVEFYFPRQVGGQPLLSAKEKSAEFRCELEKETIRTKFNLRKMKVGGELDL